MSHAVLGRLARATVAAAIAATSVSCGALGKMGNAATAPIQKRKIKKELEKQAETPPVRQPIPIGEISYINEAAGFVLIRSGRKVHMGIGADLQARRGMMLSANLAFSPEQKSGYLTADIVNGKPAVGDFVYVEPKAVPDQELRQKQIIERQKQITKAVRKGQHKRARKRLIRKN